MRKPDHRRMKNPGCQVFLHTKRCPLCFIRKGIIKENDYKIMKKRKEL